MIKFIHCADIHFDAPLGLGDSAKAAVRRQENKTSFSKMLSYASENSVDMVLISGDLFDRKNVSRQTVDFLCNEFSSYPDCKFIIAPGNSDYYSSDSVYELADFPDNVYIFKKDEISCFDFMFGENKVSVYGYAYIAQTMYNCPFENLRIEKSNNINILMAHGSLGGEKTSDGSFTVAQLAKTGADYCALGHIHSKEGIYDEGDMWYSYPGTLEVLDFDSNNNGGYVIAEAEKVNGDFVCKPRMVNIAQKKYYTENINVTGALSTDEIIETVKAKLDSRCDLSENALLRVVLVGDVAPAVQSCEKSIMDIANNKNLFYTIVDDKTVPIYNHEYLSADPTIKGALYNAFRPSICSDDESVSKQAINALRAGINALDGKNIRSGN